MKRSDWTGITTSIVVHGLLVVLLAFLGTAEPEPTNMGFIEVEFGAFAEGRQVRTAPQRPQPQPEVEEEPEQEQEERPPQAPPDESKPVELPDQAEEVQDPETVEAPETEAISPEVAEEEEEPEPEPEPQPEERVVRPLGSGALTDEQAEESGDEGPGTDEERAAPFQIEGLNRSPVTTPVPEYTEQVNALIRVRITVDPQGRIIQRVPLIRGTPSLDRAVMEALQSWRFNPLPPEAPQENQTGVITFRFRLR